MTGYPMDLWDRARDALAAAHRELPFDPDLAASRAYYAAFYAASALLAADGATFTRHSAVEAAVHRDLVKTGRWLADLGTDYSSLVALRHTADYGAGQHVVTADALAAVEAGERIVATVHEERPADFPL